jgi:quinol monooxygenase YgiN
MIYVMAAIKANDGQREELIEAFREILPLVRAKAGCLEHGLSIHLESGLEGQAAYDENVVTIVEKWVDLDALKAHINDPQYQDWFEQVWPLMADASMQILTAID